MITLKFKCFGRIASLVNMSKYDILKDAFSFSKAGVYHHPRYKKWLQEKALGIPEEDRQGWNGKTSMVKNGQIDLGLLIGAKEELEKQGIKTKIIKWVNKPTIKTVKGFIEQDIKYSYQNDAISAMYRSIPTGGGLLLSATGTGKTKIAAQFFSGIFGKCIFVVDERHLLHQSKKEIQDWLKIGGYDERVGIVGDSKFDPKRITVATIQTLQKHATHKNKTRRKEFKVWLKDIDIIMIDELHVQMGKRNFNVVTDIKPQAVIGLTATMQMKKKEVRYKVWSIAGPVIFEFPMTKGVEAGVLTQGVVLQLTTQPNFGPKKQYKEKNKRTGKYRLDAEGNIKFREANPLEHEVVNNPNLAKDVKLLVAEAMKRGYATVVLCERIRHIKKLAKSLAEHDPQLCYGGIKIKERKKTIKRFDRGKHDLIIANKVFTKGLNVKRIDLIIDTAQRGNPNDCIQKFGRGVRLYDGKTGLLYVGCFTKGYGDKAATRQRGAFKRAKIPIKTLSPIAYAFGPKSIFDQGEELLSATLTKNKTKQLELF